MKKYKSHGEGSDLFPTAGVNENNESECGEGQRV
jgi:hypothetical protein